MKKLANKLFEWYEYLTDIDADPDNHIRLAFWQTILESHGDLIQN